MTQVAPHLAIAEGIIPNHSAVHKFGFNGLVGAAEEVLWEAGNGYTRMATPTALFASSTDALDVVDRVVEIVGLDANGLTQTKSVVLTGQTQVAIPGLWTHAISRCYNSGAVATVGNVYIAESTAHPGGIPGDATTVKSFFSIAKQQSLQAIYTIPADCTGYIFHVSASCGKNDDAEVSLYFHENGGVPRIKWLARMVANAVEHEYHIPLRIPPLTTLYLTGVSATASVEASGEFDLVLVRSPQPKI